ncbi:Uncharacterised protein [Mycobacterium tuberculosis]|nr:Uncharacterised protein [Mycobacterium tuberculosis]
MITDRDEAEGDVSRPRQRHINLPEDLQRPRTLDTGSFDQFLRHALECLP